MKLRWIIPIFWSIAASTFVLFALITVGRLLFYSSFSSVNANLFFQWVYRNIGYPQTYIIAGIPIFLLAVYYFFKRDKRIRNEQYLVQITQHVQQIAEGDFELKIPIRNDEELGQLAGNINRFVERLNTSLNEERRAQQTKNELITNVSHDLRTPLTSITGYLGLIEQDLYRDEVELRYYVSLVYEESERMSQLIQDLFEFTRLRNNEMKLQTSRINLVEMLHQMTEQFQLQLETAKLQPRLHFPTPQLYVLGDGNKLRRVFENLITNAIKYGQDGQYLDIKGQLENGVVALDIINYGEVIPQSDLPHIFERFYRVEKSRSAHTGGSGLGLAIAKQIIELHGGAIGAFSDVERTVFSVRLKEHQT